MGAVSIVLCEVLTTALLAMTPCGWLAAVQVQVAACATLSIATKLLSNKLTKLKEKVGVHNYEFLYSNKQSLYCK